MGKMRRHFKNSSHNVRLFWERWEMYSWHSMNKEITCHLSFADSFIKSFSRYEQQGWC